MKPFTWLAQLAALILGLTGTTLALAELTLQSNDIRHGDFMSKTHEFKGFGCEGENLSPHLAWQGAPADTKSFAIMAYDPDAPTGSGWWHWQVINIPKSVTTIPRGAGNKNNKSLPNGAIQGPSDYGVAAFGGACPPVGHKAHRYQFTLHALSVDALEIPKGASAALIGYMVNAHTLEKTTLEALYIRR